MSANTHETNATFSKLDGVATMWGPPTDAVGGDHGHAASDETSSAPVASTPVPVDAPPLSSAAATKLFGHYTEAQSDSHDDLDGSSGRGSRAATPGKVPPTPPIARSVMRAESGANGDARNDNGVAAGADAAVAHASSASGHALPESVRGPFEQSLGADLSAVRVHTGPESAAAAGGVGARAYATGNDIHFAEGQYAPIDAFGIHLLAHEVAHTVQQSGGPATAQYKLEVSSPGDAAEAEADRAADAMVRGEPAAVTGASGVARTSVFRDVDPSFYAKTADAAEQGAVKHGYEDTHANLDVITCSNIGDVNGANAEIQNIKKANIAIEDAIDTTFASSENKSAYVDNNHTIDKLNAYVAEAGIQTTSMNNFKIMYKRLMLDFERLSSMVALSGVSGEQDGAHFTDELVKGKHLDAGDRAAVNKDSANPDAAGAATIAVKREAVRKFQTEMATSSAELGPAELESQKQQHEYLAKCNDIAAGVVPRSEPEAKTAFKELQATVEQIKGYAKQIAGFATKAVGGAVGGLATGAIHAELGTSSTTSAYTGTVGTTGQVKFDAKGMPVEESSGTVTLNATEKTKAQVWGAAIGDAVGGKVPDVAGFIAGLPFQASLNVAEAKAKAAVETQTFNAKQQQIQELKARMIDVQKSTQRFIDVGAKLERSKNGYRQAVSELAMTMDKTGGRSGKKFQSLAPFLGEAEAYLAQSRATQDVGHDEQSAAASTVTMRKDIMVPQGDAEVRWWEIEKKKKWLTGSEYTKLTKHLVTLPVGRKADSAQGGAKDDAGANETIDAELQKLQKNDTWVAQMRNRLKSELGI